MDVRFKYEDARSNLKTIRDFTERFRRELTITGGVISEEYGIISCDDYIKIMDELSLEEFAGNYLTGLLNSDVIDAYKEILDGHEDYCDLIQNTLDDEIIDTIRKRLDA